MDASLRSLPTKLSRRSGWRGFLHRSKESLARSKPKQISLVLVQRTRLEEKGNIFVCCYLWLWSWPLGNSGNVFGETCPQQREGQSLAGLLQLGSACAAEGWLVAPAQRKPGILFLSHAFPIRFPAFFMLIYTPLNTVLSLHKQGDSHGLL